MIRYTVTAVPSVEDDVARIWLSATDRPAVAEASNQIDRTLCENALQKGEEAGQGLRQVIVPPLIARFTVNQEDQVVTIWSIQHIGTMTNGH